MSRLARELRFNSRSLKAAYFPVVFAVMSLFYRDRFWMLAQPLHRSCTVSRVRTASSTRFTFQETKS